MNTSKCQLIKSRGKTTIKRVILIKQPSSFNSNPSSGSLCKLLANTPHLYRFEQLFFHRFTDHLWKANWTDEKENLVADAITPKKRINSMNCWSKRRQIHQKFTPESLRAQFHVPFQPNLSILTSSSRPSTIAPLNIPEPKSRNKLEARRFQLCLKPKPN